MSAMASQIAGVSITQTFIQAQIKENIKVPLHWPFWRNPPVTDEYTSQKATHAENGSIWWRHHGYWYYVLLVVITFNSESHTYRDLSNPLPSLHPAIPKTPLINFQLKSYEWTSVKYVSLYSSKHHCTLNQGSNYRLVITHWAWTSLLDHSNPFQTLNILKGTLFAIFFTPMNTFQYIRRYSCVTLWYNVWKI